MPINLRDQVKDLPDKPGVYLFKNGKTVLYVGKATSLRDRVRSYFIPGLATTRSPLVQKAVDDATKIDYEETPSALEALLLEAKLIKKHQPKGNSLNKDDKSFNHVVFTNEDFPRVFTVRGRDLATKHDPDEFKYVFGPFTSGNSLKQALRLMRKIFPFRGEKDPLERTKKNSPINEQMGLVPSFKDTDKREYSRLIQNLRLFFDGKKSQVVKDLIKEMKLAAKEERFEAASRIKKTIYALEHINDTALLTDEYLSVGKENDGFLIEAYDVAHTMGENMAGVMVVMEGGEFNKSRFRKFNIKEFSGSNDTGALKNILERRLNHTEWPLPNLFVVDGGKAQLNTAEKVLEKVGISIPVAAVTKGEGHKAQGFLGDKKLVKKYEREILQANNEAHRFAISWHRSKQRKGRFS